MESSGWCSLPIPSDSDLVTIPTLHGYEVPPSPPVARQLFDGFRSALSPHIAARAAPEQRVAGWSLDETRLLVFRSNDSPWAALQCSGDAFSFPRESLVELELYMGHPTARDPGGFHVAGTLHESICPLSFLPYVTIGENGERTPGMSTHRGTITIELEYHLSEAGGARLKDALAQLAGHLQCPYKFQEYSDC